MLLEILDCQNFFTKRFLVVKKELGSGIRVKAAIVDMKWLGMAEEFGGFGD
jgi:hypothetical protein